MAIARSNRMNGFWFGTERQMQWFPAPNRGAEMSPEGWGDSGTLLNGGGYAFSSFGTHKNYSFEWPASTEAKWAQLMKAYKDGTYGRGLLYFQDCLIFDKNVLPARVADPSMSINYEGSTLVYGVQPTGVPQVSGENQLPVMAASYSLNFTPAGFRRGGGGVFVPIPEGHSLLLSAIYSSTGTGGVYITRQTGVGNLSTTEKVPASPQSGAGFTGLWIHGSTEVAGVWLWVGRTSTATSTVTLNALSARIEKTTVVLAADTPAKREALPIFRGPWTPGQGHSGCRFEGAPTYVANGPLNGGQVGFAATFREVGSWMAG